MKRKETRLISTLFTFRGFLTLSLLGLVSPVCGEDALLSGIRQLTYDGRRSGEGYFSPEGNALVFQSERDVANPFYQIFVLDLESGDSHRVSPGMGKTTCAFFQPGSDRLLFASTHLDPKTLEKQTKELEFRASGKERRYSWDYDESMDIFSAKREGGDYRQLTTAKGYDAEGAYSPDGSLIVFSSLRDAYPLASLSAEDQKRYEMDPAYYGEIYIMKADGSEQRRLTMTPGYDGGPFFTPDGKRIVWRRFDEEGLIANVFTMKIDGSDVRQITDFKSMAWAPYFHPSGRYAIFTSNKLGFENFELFIVDAAGKHEPVQVSFSDGFDGLPVFSPNGKALCWTSNRNSKNQSQLYLGQWDHAGALEALSHSPLRHSEQTASISESEVLPRRPNVPAVNLSSVSPEIREADHRSHVAYLASDELEGRQTGSAGSRAAADYARNHFRLAGLKGVGLPPNYSHKFQFTKRIETASEGNHLKIESSGHISFEKTFQVEKGFRPLSFTSSSEFSGGVVFAGYGLTVPGELGEGYDSYSGLNVSNKTVLVLRYVPEEVTPERRQVLNRYAGLRYKAMIARDHGAKGILIVAGPNSPNAGELIRHSFDSSLAGSEIVAASVTSEVAEYLLAPVHKSLESLQSALDGENPHAEGGFEIPGLTLSIGTAVNQVKGTDYNVVAYLPPTNPGPESEYVIIGAHYDHLGHGGSNSLQRKGEEDHIHNGADDNASGTSVILELAASLADRKAKDPSQFQKGILFALWSGEEIGLIGSTHFAEDHSPFLEGANAYLNFDMVGRLKENKLVLQGVGSSSIWPGLIERKNVLAGFGLTLQEDPYLPTDATVFYTRGIPILSFFTGSHEDYHRPTDTADKVNYPDLTRITSFAERLVLDLISNDQRPDYVKVERAKSSGGSRDSMRAYLGTIPDYASEAKGVKLSGVSGGGPADKSGMKANDVIVEFAGKKIANIYDYTYAIDAVKIGEPVKVSVMREGAKLELEIVPEARK
ncbi:M28 family peptidase [Verrucomicrobia bacterium]|jgi:Tol biopolymer transport system component|nr:M28 family peptidase [Verrucomicrobiota bacterium]MDA7866883.1 M28 family peptidase [Verrucomicrobiota bacterium]